MKTASICVLVLLIFSSLFGVSPHSEPLPNPLVRVDGKATYVDPILLKVDTDGIRIRHADGAAKIPFDALPESLQEKFKGFAEAIKKDAPSQSDSTSTVSASTNKDLKTKAEIESLIAIQKAQLEVVNQKLAELTRASMKTSQPSDQASPPIDKSQGDPSLWSKVTQRSLGMVYVPGQGYLKVGPNGPIPKDASGGGSVARVKSQGEVKREKAEKAASEMGVDLATYYQIRAQSAAAGALRSDIDRLSSQISSLQR